MVGNYTRGKVDLFRCEFEMRLRSVIMYSYYVISTVETLERSSGVLVGFVRGCEGLNSGMRVCQSWRAEADSCRAARAVYMYR